MTYPTGFPARLRPSIDAAIIAAHQEFPQFQDYDKRVMKAMAEIGALSCDVAGTGEWRIDLAHSGLSDFLEALCQEDNYNNRSTRNTNDLYRLRCEIMKSAQWLEFMKRLIAIADAAKQPKSPVTAKVAYSHDPHDPSAFPVPTPSLRDPKTQVTKKPRRRLDPSLDLLQNKPTVNRDEAAIGLGMTTRNLDRYIEDKKIKPIGGTGRLRFDTKDLLKFFHRKSRKRTKTKVDKTGQT